MTRSPYILSIIKVGTCAMKPRDKGGVVDERLNVYGVQGLKVAGTRILISFYSTRYINDAP